MNEYNRRRRMGLLTKEEVLDEVVTKLGPDLSRIIASHDPNNQIPQRKNYGRRSRSFLRGRRGKGWLE